MFLLLKAGQEGQYKLLQCSVRCFGDHAVGPEKVSKIKWSGDQKVHMASMNSVHFLY